MQFLAFFGIHQMALSLFRFIAVVGRTEIVANTLGSFALFLVFVLGGFIVSKSKLQDFYSLKLSTFLQPENINDVTMFETISRYLKILCDKYLTEYMNL